MFRKRAGKIAASACVLAAAVSSALVAAEWLRFDGTCRTMGFPFLAAATVRECSFLEYLSTDPRGFLWLLPVKEAAALLFPAAGLASVVGVVFMVLYRRRLLRSEACPGRSGVPATSLDRAQIDALKRWERRMVRVLAGVMTYFFLLVALVLIVDPGDAPVLFLLLLLLLAAAGWATRIQFSARCPACGYLLGLQTRLLLPASCECCGVSLREEL